MDRTILMLKSGVAEKPLVDRYMLWEMVAILLEDTIWYKKDGAENFLRKDFIRVRKTAPYRLKKFRGTNEFFHDNFLPQSSFVHFVTAQAAIYGQKV